MLSRVQDETIRRRRDRSEGGLRRERQPLPFSLNPSWSNAFVCSVAMKID
jgi:hypothetical protein